MEKVDVVVGIDFGSSGMGFAFSFNDINNIEIGELSNSGLDAKVPTEIIIDNNSILLASGEQCKNYIATNKFNSYHYYKDIKLKLFNNIKKIKAENSEKEVDIELLIYEILNDIKEKALKTIIKQKPNLKRENIKWIVTVPAIWNERCKSIMIDASKKAGLINSNTDKSNFLSLEPEAASLFYLNDKSLDNNFVKIGRKYIVCDLGGGTGDIVTHIIGNNSQISEAKPPIGGNFGSNIINQKIYENVIYKIFEIKNFRELIQKLKNSNKKDEGIDEQEIFSEWIDLEEQIKKLKESLKEDKINDIYPLKLNVFKNIYSDKEFEKMVNNYNNNVLKEDWKINIRDVKKFIINIPYKIVFDLIKEQSKEIINEIKKITKKEKKIKDIIFAGGYCRCDIIINLIKQNLPEIKNFYKTSNPGIAVLKGSVIFGINPYIIEIRKAKYTIGQSVNKVWDEKKHSGIGEKFFDKERNKSYCRNCFLKYIEINQDIKVNSVITKEDIQMRKPKEANLMLYKSVKSNPEFIFEKEVEKMGECKLILDKEYPFDQRDLKISMKFGGTFIDINCIHLQSGKIIESRFVID